jgi:hypothetical protein
MNGSWLTHKEVGWYNGDLRRKERLGIAAIDIDWNI